MTLKNCVAADYCKGDDSIMEETLNTLLRNYGFNDHTRINGSDIIVGQWVRLKCKFMCHNYAERAVCPPNTPSVEDCRAFFREYSTIYLIHFEKNAYHKNHDSEVFQDIDQALIELEKDLFYRGYYKVMMMPPTICHLCETCMSKREDCRHKDYARPTPEAFAVDVFKTVKKFGYPLEILSDYDSTMDRYAFLLLE